ncbi:peptidylprolyl isomerase [Ferruginibacter sp.]
MKKIISCLLFTCIVLAAKSQTVAQIKKVLDTTSNPIGFVKYVLKKKYFIDTITVVTTGSFMGKADSLAYRGKVGKTYGPFKGENILVKILYKAPNTFYHINHIVLDTATYTQSFASSLADTIIAKIQSGRASFASMASTYSADYESSHKGGDLGWFIRGAMLPQLDEAMSKHKKGEIFTVWTAAGLHIVKIADDPKKDIGYALMLRVIL